MLKKIQAHFVSSIKKRNLKNDDEIYMYLSVLIANFGCFVAHIYMFILFSAFGIIPMVWLNVFSIAMYCTSTVLFCRKNYDAAGLFISLEVTIYALAYSLLAGISTYILGYFILAIICQAVIPYGTFKLRLIITGIDLVGIVIGIIMHLNFTPIIIFANPLENIMLVSNITLCVVGAVIELYFSTVTRTLISNINNARITELSSQAYTDALTGLYNRRYADKYFSDIMSSDRKYCVAILDIDDFKKYNDTYGHAGGDDALVFISKFLVTNLRKSDKVFRWGGEEFLIVLEGVDLVTASEILWVLQKKMTDAAIEKAHGMTVTIGVAVLDLDDITGSIAEGDKRLYTGKKNGKNMVVDAS